MPRLTAIAALVALTTISGCADRSAHIAEEAAQRQAEQNETMAKLHEQVAAGTRRLVEGDAEARQQALVVHQDLQAERAQLSGGWNELEAQRQAIASSRRTDSLLAALVKGGGGALAAILALAFGWLALFGLRGEQRGPEMGELLVDDLVAAGSFLAHEARRPLPRNSESPPELLSTDPSHFPPDPLPDEESR